MDCLKSFTIEIDQNRTFNVAGTNIKTWGTLGNYHFVIVEQGGISRYNIQGYRRIDLYGIEMLGNVQTDVGLNDAAIVQDYDFQLGITAEVPLVSGLASITPNFWAIDDQVITYDLGKFANKVTFASPYTGLKNITFNGFRAQGNNGETLNSIALDLKLQFVFYYKYEGE